jgi:hypothetical protein
MRQVAGAFAKYEKARLVEKVSAVRRRKREDAGKCEGGKTRLQRLEELARTADTDEARGDPGGRCARSATSLPQRTRPTLQSEQH